MLRAMTIDDFARLTRKVIREGGWEDFVPTAVYPARRGLLALEDELPCSADVEAESVAWAESNAQGDEDFLVVFPHDDEHFKIVRRTSGAFESAVFPVRAR
jgi:hypothetical protein